MSKDMLAPIVRALVGIPEDRLGVIFDAVNKLGSADGQLWRSRFAEVLRQGVAKAEGVQDLVHIDHSVRPSYPDWVEKGYVDTPEFIRLEQSGPSDYSLASLQLSLHPKQEQGVATGHEIYEYQKELGLEDCLGLADLVAIQALGLEAFRRHWKGKAVFGWKSVLQSPNGNLDVPYLLGGDDQLVLRWRWLDNGWLAYNPALRFDK